MSVVSAKAKAKVPAWIEAALPKKNTQTTDDPKQTLKANLLTLGDCETPEKQKTMVFAMLGPDYLERLTPMENRVLVITYVWPQRRLIRNQAGEVVGHLDLPEQTINANRFEGKTGLVIAIGPTAFKYSGAWPWEGHKPKVGDWIWYRASDAVERGYGMDISSMLWGRTIDDGNVEGIAADPRTVY